MTLIVEFTVLGTAAPQGSKIRTKWGAMREANPNTMPWRQEVAACAKKAMEGREPTLLPVMLVATFIFQRPKSHYRTGKRVGELRERAPAHMSSKPDLSKLIRAAEDAMSGIVYRDDAQIVELNVTKTYGRSAHAVVSVEELTNRWSEEKP